MADKTMLNFRCPAGLLDAIDVLGQDLYPSNSVHGCDRSKTLLDIVRAGIKALSDEPVVLQASDSMVRPCKTENAIDIEVRFAAIEERLGKIEVLRDGNSELLKQEVEELEVVQAENQRLHNELGNLQAQSEQQLFELRSQFERERTDSLENKNLALGVVELPEAASVLNQLKTKRRKSKIDLLDVESILEILEAEMAKFYDCS